MWRALAKSRNASSLAHRAVAEARAATAQLPSPPALEDAARSASNDEWVAADIQDGDAVFSEPITPEELVASRRALEAAHLLPCTGHEVDEDDAIAERQMTSIAEEIVIERRQSSELQQRQQAHSDVINLALNIASRPSVQKSIQEELWRTPDLFAEVQRLAAMHGISVQAPQRPALAGPQEPATLSTPDSEAGPDPLTQFFQNIGAACPAAATKLGDLGAAALDAVAAFVRRMRDRFAALFGLLRGGRGKAGVMGAEQGAFDRGAMFMDAVSAAACMIVLGALLRRAVPLSR